VARWVYEIAGSRGDAKFELVDIKDYDLPLLDESMSAISGKYSKDHTKAWSAKIDSFDAFVFVTPEYNHATSGALKNAIDYLYREWNKLEFDPRTMPMKPMSVEQCVSEGLNALRENRSGIVPGRMNRIMNALVPASVKRTMTAKMLGKTLANKPTPASARAQA